MKELVLAAIHTIQHHNIVQIYHSIRRWFTLILNLLAHVNKVDLKPHYVMGMDLVEVF